MRTQLRKGGVSPNTQGRFWVANEKRIYSFELDGPISASATGPGSEAGDALMFANSGMPLQNRQDPHLCPSLVEAAPGDVDRSAICASDNGKAVSNFSTRDSRQGTPASAVISASDNEDDHARSAYSNVYPLALFRPFGTEALILAFASDNEKWPPCPSTCVKNISIYELADTNSTLQSVYRGASASWKNDRIVLIGPVEKSTLVDGKISTETLNGVELAELNNPFTELGGKPSHMSIAEIRSEIATNDSEIGRRNFAVALEKRYSTLFLPLVIVLFTAPFALSLHRSGRVVTIGYAIGLWLVYTGVTYFFEEFGLNGLLPPAMAVYSPLAVFSMLGIYLLTRVRT
jgi:hypothetical protein